MKTQRWTRLASIMLAAALPLGVLAPACSTSSDTTSTIGQRISCHDDGTTISDCRQEDGPSGTGSDSCEDIDDDGDGQPHDEGEEHHRHTGVDDGTDDQGHDAVDDDDGDGVPNARDCDRRHGGDDDPADHDAGDDDGSDGAGHT